MRLYLAGCLRRNAAAFVRADVVVTEPCGDSPGTTAATVVAPGQLPLPNVDTERHTWLEIRRPPPGSPGSHGHRTAQPGQQDARPRPRRVHVAKRGRAYEQPHPHGGDRPARGQRPTPPILPPCDYYALVRSSMGRPGSWGSGRSALRGERLPIVPDSPVGPRPRRASRSPNSPGPTSTTCGRVCQVHLRRETATAADGPPGTLGRTRSSAAFRPQGPALSGLICCPAEANAPDPVRSPRGNCSDRSCLGRSIRLKSCDLHPGQPSNRGEPSRLRIFADTSRWSSPQPGLHDLQVAFQKRFRPAPYWAPVSMYIHER